MKTIRFLLVLAVLGLLPIQSALAKAETYMDNQTRILDEILWNDCTGEEIHITGSIHELNHFIITNNGIAQWGFQSKYQGVQGIGLTSGMIYRAVGGEDGYGTTVDNPDLPYHYAAGAVITMRLVARGNVPDLQIKIHYRITVTPNFDWHAEIDKYEFVCK